MGGHEAEELPSAMFLARVSCQGCHGLPAQVKAHETVQRAGQATCLSCHGVRYANILPSWQVEMERRLSDVSRVLEGARSTLGAAPLRRRASADSLLALARENVGFVRTGKAVHNIAFADGLLRSSLDLVREATQVGALPYRVPAVDLGQPIGENICLRCHLGVERSALRFQGVAFDHRDHVVAAGLDCTRCHTPLDEHGGTTLTSLSRCEGCHHSEIGARNCASCHTGPGGAPEPPIALTMGDFDEHTADDHVACTDCHEAPADGIVRWTRSVCTSCHADRTEHYAPRPCEDCHRVPALRTGRRERRGG
jgi:hypothetical protein